MTRDDASPAPATANPEEIKSLRRLLEYAQLVAGELDLALAERLIGAAVLSLTDTAGRSGIDSTTDRLPADWQPPGRIH
jgi:hypothetical protein